MVLLIRTFPRSRRWKHSASGLISDHLQAGVVALQTGSAILVWPQQALLQMLGCRTIPMLCQASWPMSCALWVSQVEADSSPCVLAVGHTPSSPSDPVEGFLSSLQVWLGEGCFPRNPPYRFSFHLFSLNPLYTLSLAQNFKAHIPIIRHFI